MEVEESPVRFTHFSAPWRRAAPAIGSSSHLVRCTHGKCSTSGAEQSTGDPLPPAAAVHRSSACHPWMGVSWRTRGCRFAIDVCRDVASVNDPWPLDPEESFPPGMRAFRRGSVVERAKSRPCRPQTSS